MHDSGAVSASGIPVFGFVAPSGSGKTTLLRRVVELLHAKGVRIGYLKHAHHRFDLDTPGKDSYEIRAAGAAQTLLASRLRWALQVEDPSRDSDPDLGEMLVRFEPGVLDLILVEGFKHASYPKIEVYRSALGQPPLYPEDPEIIAVATEDRLPTSGYPQLLPLDDPQRIADFILSASGLLAKINTATPAASDRSSAAADAGVTSVHGIGDDPLRFLAELIDSLPDALFAIDADGVVTVWNRAMEEMSGIPRGQILGRGDQAHALAFYAKRRPMLVDLALGSYDEGMGHYDFVRRDGDCIMAEAHGLSVFGREGVFLWAKAVALRDREGRLTGALEIIRDITEQKHAERALKASEARFRSLVSNTPVVIFELDGEGVFRLVEGRGLESLGLESGAMVGTGFAECFGSSPEVVDAKRRALAGESARFTANLGSRVFETYLNPVHSLTSEAISVIGVAVDITERTQREIELQQRTDELVRFTYTVSHDLKSPLVTIQTFLGFLEEDMRLEDVDRVAKDLEFIRNAADRMTRLLDELLELSRIGRVINAPTDFSLQEVVRDALDLVAGRIVSKGVRVRVSDIPIMIRGDRQRLVEVFQNLFDNAVKFMVDQSEPCIEVEVDRPEDEWIFSVADNGIGIDTRHMHKVFGLFEQLNSEAEGTGIGLTLVKRIVELHGGHIWVESAGIGHGSCFRFTLSEAYRAD